MSDTGNQSNTIPAGGFCPLSGENGKALFKLGKEKIVKSLETYFGRTFPEEIRVGDYTICESPTSGLVYAWPLDPAPDSFYAWCAQDPGYYPESRPEWDQVAEIMKAAPESNTPESKLLDVGCGDGRALLFLKKFYHGRLEGVDLSDESAESCRKRGFKAFSGDFVELMQQGVLPEASYDWVLSFHCLEHVRDPLSFVGGMARLLQSGGSLLISTPLSPMSFESDYFDIMNFPPHHMTRWNIKAYEALAAKLGLDLKVHLLKVRPWWSRAWQTFKLKRLGRTRKRPGPKELLRLAFSPVSLLSIIRKQMFVNLPDIILVQLTS